MRNANKQAPQGDVQFARCESVPDGFVPTHARRGVHIVAHSENGHPHTVDASDAIMYEGPNQLRAYLRLEKDCAEVTHHKNYDQHESIGLGGGVGAVWEIRRQREYDPAGERRAAD